MVTDVVISTVLRRSDTDDTDTGHRPTSRSAILVSMAAMSLFRMLSVSECPAAQSVVQIAINAVNISLLISVANLLKPQQRYKKAGIMTYKFYLLSFASNIIYIFVVQENHLS